MDDPHFGLWGDSLADLRSTPPELTSMGSQIWDVSSAGRPTDRGGTEFRRPKHRPKVGDQGSATIRVSLGSWRWAEVDQIGS